MPFRVVTLNLEQDHKRWERRRPLIEAEIARLKPDIVALNEVSVPLQTARGLRQAASAACGRTFNLVQQTRANGLRGLRARRSSPTVLETANLDFVLDRGLVARLRLAARRSRCMALGRSARVHSAVPGPEALGWIESHRRRACSGKISMRPGQTSAALMASRFRPTQTAPTAFTPLAGTGGEVSHPYWPRMDRCIDYIWVSEKVKIVASGTCFDRASPDDPSLWPSDHAGVWADLELG